MAAGSDRQRPRAPTSSTSLVAITNRGGGAVMSDVLDKICADKREHVAARKAEGAACRSSKRARARPRRCAASRAALAERRGRPCTA